MYNRHKSIHGYFCFIIPQANQIQLLCSLYQKYVILKTPQPNINITLHLQFNSEIRKQQKRVWSRRNTGVVRTKNRLSTFKHIYFSFFFAKLGLKIVKFLKHAAFKTK